MYGEDFCDWVGLVLEMGGVYGGCYLDVFLGWMDCDFGVGSDVVVWEGDDCCYYCVWGLGCFWLLFYYWCVDCILDVVWLCCDVVCVDCFVGVGLLGDIVFGVYVGYCYELFLGIVLCGWFDVVF